MINSRRIHSDYLRGYIAGFEAERGTFNKWLYKISGEPPIVKVYRKILSERKYLTERLIPS